MVPRTRRVQRVHLAQPLLASLGAVRVLLIDIGLLGARIEHHIPLPSGTHTRLSFTWEGEEISSPCRIVRSQFERLAVGPDGLTVYHSGIEFENTPADTRVRLKAMIGRFIARALEEQKLNARGAIPEHDLDRMPIFRFGQLAVRLAREIGFVCFALENNVWHRKRTYDPGQPLDGFTISAAEEHTQAELLCDAYLRADPEGRKLIQLFAQLSINEVADAVSGES